MRRFLFTMMVSLLCVSIPAYSDTVDDEFPLIWVSATDMVYAGGETEGGYGKVFHLSYKYSSDWILVMADNALFEEDSITYASGIQFTFDATGKNTGELRFTEFFEVIDLSVMEKASLGEDGSILTPFTGPDIGYAVAQAKDGTLNQISLANDAEEVNGNLHLYDGFLYQFDSNLVLLSQIAFSEISFSTKGLLRSSISAPPHVEGASIPLIPEVTTSISPYEVTLEGGGSSFVAGEGSGMPEIVLPEDYIVPPIKKLGVVYFHDGAKRPDLAGKATDILFDSLSGIEGTESLLMEFDDRIWGGGILLHRAVELGQEYGVDAFIISDLTDFDYPSMLEMKAFNNDLSLSCEMDFAIVDCIGGQIFWRTTGDKRMYAARNDFKKNGDGLTNSVLKQAVREGVDRLISDSVFAGGQIGKDWTENEDQSST